MNLSNDKFISQTKVSFTTNFHRLVEFLQTTFTETQNLISSISNLKTRFVCFLNCIYLCIHAPEDAILFRCFPNFAQTSVSAKAWISWKD